MSIRYNMAVKVGGYEKNGKKKNRYQRIGRVMDGKDGGLFVLLDALYVSNQLNGLANRERRDAIIVSLFEEGEREDTAKQSDPVTDKDIPF